MKLRIDGKSVRLRLTQTEVTRFLEHGRVDETLDFGGGARLNYSLESVAAIASPQALFEGSVLRIQVPSATAREWGQSDRVGISGGDAIAITVEKDFQCLHGPGATDPDAFPNPLAHKH